MKGSHSWRITKPLRGFTLFLKRLKNRNSYTKRETRVSKKPQTNNYSADISGDLLRRYI